MRRPHLEVHERGRELRMAKTRRRRPYAPTARDNDQIWLVQEDSLISPAMSEPTVVPENAPKVQPRTEFNYPRILAEVAKLIMVNPKNPGTKLKFYIHPDINTPDEDKNAISSVIEKRKCQYVLADALMGMDAGHSIPCIAGNVMLYKDTAVDVQFFVCDMYGN